ncbi:unnamed protein product, partial [Rotaria sp. Silwood1]
MVSELLHHVALIDQRVSQDMTYVHVTTSHGTINCIRVFCGK